MEASEQKALQHVNGSSEIPAIHGKASRDGLPLATLCFCRPGAKRHLGDSNPCGQSPMDFESISLAARTKCLAAQGHRDASVIQMALRGPSAQTGRQAQPNTSRTIPKAQRITHPASEPPPKHNENERSARASGVPCALCCCGALFFKGSRAATCHQ